MRINPCRNIFDSLMAAEINTIFTFTRAEQSQLRNEGVTRTFQPVLRKCGAYIVLIFVATIAIGPPTPAAAEGM
jgi:hypothetical protein